MTQVTQVGSSPVISQAEFVQLSDTAQKLIAMAVPQLIVTFEEQFDANSEDYNPACGLTVQEFTEANGYVGVSLETTTVKGHLRVKKAPFLTPEILQIDSAIRKLSPVEKKIYQCIYSGALFEINKMDLSSNLPYSTVALMEKRVCYSDSSYTKYLSYMLVEHLKQDKGLDLRLFQEANLWKEIPFPSKESPEHKRQCFVCNGVRTGDLLPGEKVGGVVRNGEAVARAKLPCFQDEKKKHCCTIQ